MQDEPRLPGWTGPALCGCTLSGSRSYLATANLTSLLPPRRGVLGLIELSPAPRMRRVLATLSHPPTAPGGSPLLPENQADLFCQRRRPICFPALPALSKRRASLSSAAGPGRGGGALLSQGHTACSRAPYCPAWE